MANKSFDYSLLFDPKPGTRSYQMTDAALKHAIATYNNFHSHRSHAIYLKDKLGYSLATWEKYLRVIAKAKGPRVTGGLTPEERIAKLME